MVKEFIMQMRPWFDESEKEALVDLMDNETFLTEFRHTEKFEEALKGFTNAKHCILVNNGTISLTIAAYALGIGHGDEVIIPGLTVAICGYAVWQCGAVPVYADVKSDTFLIDPIDIEKKITN